MAALIAGRTASDMPGLDIAEQKSWQNFLDSTLRLYATRNRQLTEAHELSLFDVRVLDMLDHAPSGSVRMGDLAEALASLPSRLTRQIRRLESQGLVRREASKADRRGVVAAITADGRAAAEQAAVEEAQRPAEQLPADIHPPIAKAVNGDGAEAGERPVAAMGAPVFADLPPALPQGDAVVVSGPMGGWRGG